MPDAERIARLRGLGAHLSSSIRGQEHLLPRVTAALLRAEFGLAAPARPVASFFFLGPTGTGKTELAKCFTEYLFGAERLFRFDLSEYQNQSSVERLLGQDRSDRGLLGQVLATQRKGTLLFDESEKAHPLVLDLFLQMLDAARITTATGETFSLEGFVIVFTSNLGSAEALRMERSSHAAIEAATLRRLQQSLRAEFIARLDERLVFARLTPPVLEEICSAMITREISRLRQLGHDLACERSVAVFLMRQGYDRERGARPMRQAVEQHIQQAVVNELFRTGTVEGTLQVNDAASGLCIRPRHPREIAA